MEALEPRGVMEDDPEEVPIMPKFTNIKVENLFGLLSARQQRGKRQR